jgi:hypothetical protein
LFPPSWDRLTSAYLVSRGFRSSLQEKRTHDFKAAVERVITVAQRAHNMQLAVADAKQKDQQERFQKKQLAYEELLDKELTAAVVGIYLYLDPDDPSHKKLRDMVEQFGAKNMSAPEFNALRNRAIKAARIIAQQEYDKAKAGK